MNDLIRKTARTVKNARDYGGVCENCGGQVGRAGDMTVVEIDETDEYWLVVPIDLFACPHCGNDARSIRIWKSLDVTKEFVHEDTCLK